MVRPMLAHIAGLPVEETALSFAPVMLLASGVATSRIRDRVRAGRRRRRYGQAAPARERRR